MSTQQTFTDRSLFSLYGTRLASVFVSALSATLIVAACTTGTSEAPKTPAPRASSRPDGTQTGNATGASHQVNPAPRQGTRAQSHGSTLPGSSQFTQLSKAIQVKTASGATFTGPARWYMARRKSMVFFRDPEQDLFVAVLEVQGKDLRSATAKAWKAVRPGFARPIDRVVQPPAKGGWDEVGQITYKVADGEHRILFALARRHGKTWYVNLFDGSQAGFSRRAAQALTIATSLKAPGLQEENFANAKPHALDAPKLATLARFFDQARKDLEIPGAAMAIVHGGKVIFKKGFGVRRMGGRRPVTTKTLFMIGSTSKPLTTLLMARLVDKGLFRWDTPVTKVLPSFKFADPKLTQACRMEHTVCACTGMPRQDLEFIFQYKGVTPKQRIETMESEKPTTAFGETFQYSNLMVALGGFAAAHALYPKRKLGPAYDRAMERLVFRSLGMHSTTLDPHRAVRKNHAIPHSDGLDGKVQILKVQDELGVYPIRPAGAIWSNVEDMARYLMLELGKGRMPDGRQIVSAKNLLERRKPRIRILSQRYYGLGLMLSKEYGLTLVHHGGNNLGYTTGMFFYPDLDIGVIIQCNKGSANILTKLTRRRLIELLFDAKPKAARLLAWAVKEDKAEQAAFLERIDLRPNAQWLSRVSGRYVNDQLGPITITASNGEGWLDAGEWRARIAMKKGRAKVAWLVIGAPLTGLSFQPGMTQGKKTLTLSLGQERYLFVEKSPNSPAGRHARRHAR